MGDSANLDGAHPASTANAGARVRRLSLYYKCIPPRPPCRKPQVMSHSHPQSATLADEEGMTEMANRFRLNGAVSEDGVKWSETAATVGHPGPTATQ